MAPFASYVDLVKHLGLSQDEAASQLDVEAATRSLEAASARIRAACGWSVTQETVTGQLVEWDWRQSSAFLPTLHLTALSVNVDGAALTDRTEFTWQSNGVVRLHRTGRVSYGWLRWPGPLVSITYTHGYPTAPDALRDVCCELAADKMGLGRPLASVTVGNVTEVYNRLSDAPEPTRMAADPRVAAYTLPVVG